MNWPPRLTSRSGRPRYPWPTKNGARLKGWIIQEQQKGVLDGEPLVLVGHSWGADDQVRVAEMLGQNGIQVDLLVLIDPVTPPLVPPNVKRCYCIYKSHPVTDAVPFCAA